MKTIHQLALMSSYYLVDSSIKIDEVGTILQEDSEDELGARIDNSQSNKNGYYDRFAPTEDSLERHQYSDLELEYAHQQEHLSSDFWGSTYTPPLNLNPIEQRKPNNNVKRLRLNVSRGRYGCIHYTDG